MGRYICIKKSRDFTVGRTYYGRICYIQEYECFEGINDAKWKEVTYLSNMMPYNEWLALEREKQMKNILDE